MLEFLKKIGLPGIIAAIISAVVTMIPFLFQLDERYAKADEIDQRIAVLTKQTTDLTIEVGRLAGTTQVLVSIMSKSERDRAPVELDARPQTRTVPPVLNGLIVPSSPNTSSSSISIQSIPNTKAKLDEVSRSLDRTQRNVEAIKRY